MATLDARCLDAFPNWLRSLGEDARALASVLEKEGSGGAQRRAAAALNYLFKSLDLIPDGLEDLGFIDDAFVVRAAADAVKQESESELTLDASGTLSRLAAEAELVREIPGCGVCSPRQIRGRVGARVCAWSQRGQHSR